MAQVINLTKHSVIVRTIDGRGVIERITPDSRKISVVKTYKPIGEIGGLPVAKTEYKLVNLPQPEKDTYLIVEEDILIAAKETGRATWDLLVPAALDFDETVDGREIQGCRYLACD